MDASTDNPTGRLSRRGVLLGIGIGLSAPVATALTGGPAMAHPRHAAQPRPAPARKPPECLSGLVQEGWVTYADLMAG